MKQQITPYLTFNGEAKEALEFYKHVFDAEITRMQTFAEGQFDTPEGMGERILHARLEKGDMLLMFSDTFENKEMLKGNNVSLVLELDNSNDIETYYTRLKEDGDVLMELQDTFWGATYGKVRDKYGLLWDLNYEKNE